MRRLPQWKVLALLASSLVFLGLALTSPVLFGWLFKLFGDANLVRLSNIGQAYGAISALLTALSLIGIVGSILLQSAELRAAREQAIRSFHSDLLLESMRDPELLGVLSPVGGSGDAAVRAKKRAMYANLWMAYWIMRYRVGRLSNDDLHRISGNLFRTRPGRNYWGAVRDVWRGRCRNGIDEAFVAIVEEEYAAAASSSSIESLEDPDRILASSQSRGECRSHGQVALVGLFGGVAIGAAYRYLKARK